MNKRVLITEKETGIIYNIMTSQIRLIKLLGLTKSRYTNLKDWKRRKVNI